MGEEKSTRLMLCNLRQKRSQLEARLMQALLACGLADAQSPCYARVAVTLAIVHQVDQPFRRRQLHHSAFQIDPLNVTPYRQDLRAGRVLKRQRSNRSELPDFRDQSAVNHFFRGELRSREGTEENPLRQLFRLQLIVSHPERQRVHPLLVRVVNCFVRLGVQ